MGFTCMVTICIRNDAANERPKVQVLLFSARLQRTTTLGNSLADCNLYMYIHTAGHACVRTPS